MSKLTKETLIPIGLVSTIIGVAFNAGKVTNRLEILDSQVHAIEVDRASKIENYNQFQREILQRLTRIESAVSKKEE